MDRLSTILPRTLQKHGFAEEAKAALLTHRASTWIASRLPALAQYCRVRKCEGIDITVETTHPAVAQELSRRVCELQEHLSAKDGPSIRVRIIRATSLAKGF